MRDDQYVLNHCTVCLARSNRDRRHDFGFGHFAPGDSRARIREAWRFPIVDVCFEPPVDQPAQQLNDVTFVYRFDVDAPDSVSVVGTFAPVYTAVPLRRIRFLTEETSYFAVTVSVPRQAVFFYKFLIDDQLLLDPVNPQRQILDNGAEWSRFFTWECTRPIVLQPHELAILERLCDHILPFRTEEGQRFLSWYYDGLDDEARQGVVRSTFRLDDSVGAANYIDKILAREEAHHLVDYRICLRQIARLLRQRDPDYEPKDASREAYVSIYNEMAADNVAGWDKDEYGSPRHFLGLVRRHAFTGAFAHPKYGGNVSAAGWQYLKSRFPFAWARSLESPLGANAYYRG